MAVTPVDRVGPDIAIVVLLVSTVVVVSHLSFVLRCIRSFQSKV